MMHPHNNQNKIRLIRKNIALAAFVAISAFVLLYAPARTAFTETVFLVAPKVWNMGNTVKNIFGSFLANFRSKNALVLENDALRADITRMQAQVLDRNLLEEQVNKLEETLGRTHSDNRVVAYVIAGPALSPYDTIVVDAGSDEGIIVGNAVVYAGSGVIGEITEVQSGSSKIKLYSSYGEEHAVLVGSHNIPVTAYGRGMGNFDAKVPQNSPIAIGDNVVSREGLVLGAVASQEGKPSDPIKRVLFRFPFNIAEIRSVEIIKAKE